MPNTFPMVRSEAEDRSLFWCSAGHASCAANYAPMTPRWLQRRLLHVFYSSLEPSAIPQPKTKPVTRSCGMGSSLYWIPVSVPDVNTAELRLGAGPVDYFSALKHLDSGGERFCKDLLHIVFNEKAQIRGADCAVRALGSNSLPLTCRLIFWFPNSNVCLSVPLEVKTVCSAPRKCW